MKKYLPLLLIGVLFVGTSCEEQINIENEKQSIKETIDEVLNNRSELNFKGYIKFWLDEPETFIAYAGKSGYKLILPPMFK